MKIDIIGANTKEGITLRNKLIELSNNINEKVTINLIYDKNIQQFPILYIDGKLISKNKIIRDKEIVKYMKKNYKE